MFRKEDDFEKLCLKLNYQFRNKELLAQAITTRAAWRNNLQKAVIGHHEEMAFFGDGILRMVVDKILMEEFPYYNVGNLSKVRDLLVKNANLSEAAKKLELEQFILMDSSQIIQCQQGNPKLLADTIEAIIYAIYKDSGESLHEVKRFILSHSGISDALEKHREEEEKRRIPIIIAIRSGKVEIVQKMLEEDGFPPNFLFSHIEYDFTQDMFYPSPIVHKKSLTPLDHALDCLEKIAAEKLDTKNMLSIIECLLKFGANPNLHAKDNTTLISQLFSPRTFDGKVADTHFARYNQQYNVKNDPKKYIANIDKIIEKELIPGWENITDQVVEMLCRFGAKLDEENYSEDETLLELAIIHKQKHKIDLLLKYKINLNTQNRLGETPLHLAALFADEKLIIKLLNAGADPTIADKEGSKPFDMAPKSELKILLLKAEIKHVLPGAIEEINVEKIKFNAMDHYNKWLKDKLPEELVQAIRLFSQVLKYKLRNRNFEDKSLVTDFYNLGSAYFQRRNYEKAKPLLEKAYVLYQINEQQFQPKTNKYLDRLTECKKILEKNKPRENTAATLSDLHDLTKEGKPPRKLDSITAEDKQLTYDKFDQELFSATQSYNSEKIKNLLNNGANPDANSKIDGPILHYAIQTYHQAVLMAETTSDIPYNEVGIGGFKGGALKVIETLLAYGADPNQPDEKGRTALHVAAILDRPNVISLLLKKGADPNLRDHSNNFASHYAKESYTRHLILSALTPTQSTKEAIPSLFSVPMVPTEKSSQVKGTFDQNDFTNKTEKVEPNIPKRNDSNNKDKQNITVKPSFADNSKRKPSKTSPCKFFKEGKPNSCAKGDQCKFAHGAAELKMQLNS